MPLELKPKSITESRLELDLKSGAEKYVIKAVIRTV